MERRRFLITGFKAATMLCGAAALSTNPALAQGRRRRRAKILAVEAGDPDASAEYVNIQKAPIDQIYRAPVTRGIRKDPERMALATLDMAKTYLGISRSSRPDQVEKFLNLFGLHIRYPNGEVVPYCASGLAYAACHAYSTIAPPEQFDTNDPVPGFKRVLSDINHYYFKPSPACRLMVRDAIRRGVWSWGDQTATSAIKPGWLVFYNWKKRRRGVAQHVGIVDHAGEAVVNTVEFNTSDTSGGSQSNGGAVARKQRPYQFVLGYIKTH
jgi:hypothetical protein